RSGPVSTKDLWFGFGRNLPLFVVMGAVTLGACFMTRQFSPLMQLLICVPIGLLAGVGTILAIRSQREIAQHVLSSISGTFTNKLKGRQ
ncbi:MAG TPA: hypothetical protein VK731_03885, partial [Candidatus Cybelea sp.]|nr:hypothetical protein [Candidatus Cybelea sp.]